MHTRIYSVPPTLTKSEAPTQAQHTHMYIYTYVCEYVCIYTCISVESILSQRQ